jgi:hypothetical protein
MALAAEVSFSCGLSLENEDEGTEGAARVPQASAQSSVPSATDSSDRERPPGPDSSPPNVPEAQTPAPPNDEPTSRSESEFQRSIERAVNRVLAEAADPCGKARREGTPCFPTSVDREGPTVSVAGDLEKWSPLAQGRDQSLFRSIDREGLPPTPGMGFDPVCAGKLLFRLARGKNSTYYLYRVWDERGERAVLSETEKPPEKGPANPARGFVFLRKITGQCEALAAYNALNVTIHQKNKPKPGPAGPTPATRGRAPAGPSPR